jgi:hypothetical protein
MPDTLVDYLPVIKDMPQDKQEEMKEVPPFDQNITLWVKKLKDALQFTGQDALVKIGKLSAVRLNLQEQLRILKEF